MIISRIQIENYKQYRGAHDIEFPEDAIVGVIGDNGTGKTTLFEAIEWCLYNPRTIAQGDVRPRGFTGHTSVTVHLQTSDRSQQYIVQRVLKRTPSATIYRIDELGGYTQIVQGTRQVSEYVADTLIGLSHGAFTATFFTRQKELHLFGSEPPAKRREAVGRMLGLETIRLARRSIMDDRQGALADAKAIRTQYERESLGRDFDKELADAQAAIAACEVDVAAAAESATTCAKDVAAAEAALAAAQKRRDQSVHLARETTSRQRERQSCDERIQQISTEIDRIEVRERERTGLTVIADTYPELKSSLDAMEREKERFDRKRDLERRREDLCSRRRHLIDGIAGTVSSISPAHAIDGWHWSHEDDIAPADGMARLLSVIAGLDLAAAEAREQQLRDCADAVQAVAEGEIVLARYRDRQQELHKEEQSYLAAGEPRSRLPQLDRERERAIAQATTLAANQTSQEAERDRSRLLLQNLRQQQFGDDCPTCGRPFAEGDAEIVITAIEGRIAGLESAIAESMAGIKASKADVARIDVERKHAAESQAKLDDVRARIGASVSYIQEQLDRVTSCQQERDALLGKLELSAPPGPEAIKRAQMRVRDLQAVARTRRTIEKALRDLESIHSEESQILAERVPLADVSFDPAAFARLQNETHRADRARAEVSQIDRDLERRPGLQDDLNSHRARLESLDGQLADLAAQHQELGFDEREPAVAQEQVQVARTAATQAQNRYHQLLTTLRESEIQRSQVERERDRLTALAAEADRRQRQADEFDLMSREFMEFERFAGERKVPILNEATSALVDAITNGKYSRVEFDQDFGIKVFDSGEVEESYDVDTFSGGERDAIMLAARLALSQMIGRQAANPPGFLVLDEVFGSLDADRRAHLLGLLGTITATFDDLRQVFIISHVDDVRTSSVMDEVWRVEATPEGGSQLTALGAGVDLD